MEDRESRRSFIKKIIWGVFGLEVAYLTWDFLSSKSKAKDSQHLFNAGKVSSFEPNKMYPFSSQMFYLSVLEDGGMLALSVKCTHLGCIVRADKQGFHCPCHASSFDKYGEVKSPPATRALDIFSIKIIKGELYIDTAVAIKRKAFDKSQLSYS